MQFALLLITLLGHVFLWIGILNRLHSRAVPRRPMKAMSIICLALIGPFPVIAVCCWFAGGKDIPSRINGHAILHSGWLAFLLYAMLCWTAGAATFRAGYVIDVYENSRN